MAKIKVPEGMLDAVLEAQGPSCDPVITKSALEAALRWLSENPIGPTQKQSRDLYRDVPQGLLVDEVPSWYAEEWQRRMFLAPELEIPKDVSDIISWFTVYCGEHPEFEEIKREVVIAFRRGQESKV